MSWNHRKRAPRGTRSCRPSRTAPTFRRWKLPHRGHGLHRAFHREPRRRKQLRAWIHGHTDCTGAVGVNPDEARAFATYVAELEPPEFEANVRADELSSAQDDRLDRVRATVPLVEELVRTCYQGALSDESGNKALAGGFVVDYRAIGDRYFGAKIEDSTLSHPMAQVCAQSSLHRLALLKKPARLGASLARYRFSLLPP